MTLKGNARIGPSYPGADDMDFVAFPSVSFRRAGTPVRYSAPDDGLSFSFVEQSSLTIGVVGRYQGGRYLASDRRLFGLEKIDWAIEPGVFMEYWPVEFLRARAEIRHGINGHDGFVADFGLDVVQRYGAFTLSVGPARRSRRQLFCPHLFRRDALRGSTQRTSDGLPTFRRHHVCRRDIRFDLRLVGSVVDHRLRLLQAACR